MNKKGRSCSTKGFTLVEILVVFVVLAVTASLGLPALFNAIQRTKTEGVVRNAATLMRAARYEAIKGGLPVSVQMDYAGERMFSYRELADPPDGFTSGTDVELTSVPLEGVLFWGPADGAPQGADASVGFAEVVGGEGYAVFRLDGSVDSEGAFRFRDLRTNHLEVRVAPPATGRVLLQKWEDHGAGDAWFEQDQGGHSWVWN